VIASNIHDALRQVRDIKAGLLAGETFTVYSGRMRALAGAFALLGAIIMSRSFYPATIRAHLIGWGVVMAAAFSANYFALFRWFFHHPDRDRDWRRLVPAAEGLPPIFVGGILSTVFILHGLFAPLFGMWMCLFGLTNLSSRRVLPKGSRPLGFFYIACGSGCLFISPSFINPWPMGIVFFVGEILGGYIFDVHRLPEWRLKFDAAARRRGRR
jgi:hypothetical protein